jgi:uncharacterized protein (TIGR02246 family)
MSDDEHAIRELIGTWHRATAAGDVDGVLALMSEDVVFLVAGQPPMHGRAAFERGLRDIQTSHRFASSSDVQEIVVSGDLAYCWSALRVEVEARSGGAKFVRAGNALSILRKSDGTWRVVRDANLLTLVA